MSIVTLFNAIGSADPEKIFENVFTLYGHGRHLSHLTRIIYIHIGSYFLKCFMWNLALIGQVVSEKNFEYFCNIHVYCPGVGAD